MLLKCDEIVIRGNLFNAELLILEKRQPERKERIYALSNDIMT